MKTWVRRSLNVGVLGAGFLLVSGPVAAHADQVSGPNAGIGSGNQLSSVLSDWIAHNDKLAQQSGDAGLAAISDSQRKLIAAIAVAILLSTVLGYLTFRQLVYPIRGLKTSVESIAAGDFLRSVP